MSGPRSLVLAGSASLLALAPRADELAFRPASGAEVGKSLELSLEVRVESLEMTVNGEPMPDGMDGAGEETFEASMLVGVRERYVASREGRPTELHRTYEDLELEFVLAGETDAPAAFQSLEGRTVRFLWDEEKGEYARSFTGDSAGDEEDLADLHVDMDLRVLLPREKVSEGDTWKVRGRDVAPLFLPGGLPGRLDDEDPDADLAEAEEELAAAFERFVEDLDVTCTFQGVREAEGVRVGETRFTFAGRGETDLARLLELLASDEATPDVEATARGTLELEGEGELLWDLAAGRVHAFRMNAKAGLAFEATAEFEVEGEGVEVTVEGRVSATAEWKLSTSRP